MARKSEYGMRWPSSSVAVFVAGSSAVSFDWGDHPMSRSSSARRMPSDASSEIGTGLGIGLTILIVLAARSPRFSK